MRWRKWFSALILCGLGCSGPHLSNGILHKGDRQWPLGELGDAWTRIEVGEEDVAWRNLRSNATILVQATCERYEDAPLKSLARHLTIGMTDVKTAEQREIDYRGRAALWSVHSARLDGVWIRMVSLVLKKDGCILDQVLTAPPGSFEEARRDFEAFTGVRITRPGR